MKLSSLLAAAVWSGTVAIAQTTSTTPSPASPSPAATRALAPAPPADAASADAVVRALYAGVSHAPGEDPDWSQLRTIFLPGGRLIPPRRANGDFTFLTADDFIARVSKGTATRKAEGKEAGFSEREIARKTDCYGNICQLFSTYESRYAAADPKPFARGINAIQLVKDGNRWWIVNVLWDQETPEKPIPAAYLK